MSRPIEVTFDGFVHAQNGTLADGRGRPILMRGVGLGNWLLPEGYMWRFPRGAAQSPREIEALITSLVGERAASEFWRTFRDRFIAEADIERIAAEGFDHVRLPMNARLLIDDAGDMVEEGFAVIDRLVGWCRRHGLWIVLDLHAAPGGQTGTNIDDSPRGLPDLFLVGGRYRDLTIRLWTELARRYRGETVIAAYDLLNEPLPHEYGDRFADDLVSLYRELTRAVRSVDPDHLITYEGTHWSTDWRIFTEALDPNSMLQFHKYWSVPDRASIASFIETGERLGLPIYMGEGGENDPAWLQTAFGMYEDLGISWNFWPWKKLDTWSSPASVSRPAGWEALVRHAAGEGPRPGASAAGDLLQGFLDRLPLDACDYRQEIVSALFHRVPLQLAVEAFALTSRDRAQLVTPAMAGMPFDYEDRPVVRRTRFQVTLATGDWVEYWAEPAGASRLRAEVGLRLEGGADAPPVIVIDGSPVPAVLARGRLRTMAVDLAAPRRVAVRIQAASDGTVIESLDLAIAD